MAKWGVEPDPGVVERASEIAKTAQASTLECHLIRNMKDEAQNTWKASFEKYHRKYSEAVNDDMIHTALLKLYVKYRGCLAL